MRLLFAVIALLVFLGACGGDGGPPEPTPTPAPSYPGPTFEVAEGVLAHIDQPPPLPEGAMAISRYYVFQSLDDTGVGIGVAIDPPQTTTAGLGFFTYSDGEWTGINGGITLKENGTVLEGLFPAVPRNAVVLVWPDAPTPEEVISRNPEGAAMLLGV